MKYWVFLILIASWACENQETKKSSVTTEVTVNTEQASPTIAKNEAHQLILDMMDKTGDYNDLLALKDVQYEYIYKKSPTAIDVSEERYTFKGEKSWAQYDVHTASLLKDKPGRIIQGYDGENSWMTLNGEPIHDPKLLKGADFSRKTNFYWFAMMQKLNDPGLKYAIMPQEKINDIDYQVVKVTFNNGVGDAQDDYILYLNPDTNLADRFTFTVRDFGREAPLLMEVKYTKHDGVRLPTYRRYAPIDENGQVDESKWIEEISDKIKFNNNFPADMYKAPVTG